MLVDCDSCRVRGPACDGCVVQVLLGAPQSPQRPVVELDLAEQAAIAVLARHGLVPPLRLVLGSVVEQVIEPMAGTVPPTPHAAADCRSDDGWGDDDWVDLIGDAPRQLPDHRSAEPPAWVARASGHAGSPRRGRGRQPPAPLAGHRDVS